MPSTASVVRRTTPKSDVSGPVYSELLTQIKEAGLLSKTPRFYINRLLIITAAAVVLWAGVTLSFTLLPGGLGLGLGFIGAALLGVIAAQYGFIAHEAAHKQIFAVNKTNEWVGLVLANLFAGLSYGFWLPKHNRHHAKPNQIDYDPDINIRVLSFTTESVEKKKGVEKLLTRNQGWLFPILLLFTGFDLLLDSFVSVFSKKKNMSHRGLEFTLMMFRQLAPFVAFWFLTGNVVTAGLLWLTMMMMFGLFMGLAFAPNHKGMPLVPENSRVGFFERQVLTSRNIRSSWWSDNFMGGLNFQVEHHLFPSMSRPNLKKAHQFVVDYCKKHNVPFVEVGFLSSYGIIIKYLNKVGLSNNTKVFACPMIATFRPREIMV